ncbi:MAG: cation:proton antiporter, partial [Sinobacterium sp.]|nr:cation:proton antiporter [Sinobacterium sp.]
MSDTYIPLATLAGLVFFYSLIAKRVEQSFISGPMIFTAAGFALGGWGLGVFGEEAGRNELRLLADLTLALVLFSDAANANLSVLRKNYQLPLRMLLMSLPVSIFLGFVVAVLIFDSFTIYEAAILATMLAATDAALGKSVITNEKIPARIREGLNVESGFNDGLCVPILLLLIALALN